MKALWAEMQEDEIFNGAAALAYYLMLAIFPAMIALLSIVAFLPIPNLTDQVMGLLDQALPGEAARTFTGVITEVTTNRKGGLLSIGLLGTLWAASAGMIAVMQQLNHIRGCRETRPFYKVRPIALGLTLVAGTCIVGSLGLVVFGDVLQGWVSGLVGERVVLAWAFAAARYLVIGLGLALAFSCIYRFGPTRGAKFRLLSPGSVAGVVALALACAGFKLYVTSFSDYSATYGSIGAVIVLMLWLYVVGLAVLFGAEVNEVAERRGAPRERARPVAGDRQDLAA